MFVDSRLNIFKMSVLFNFIYRFNALPMKVPSYFVDIGKLILKFILRAKRPRIVNTKLKKKNKVGQTLPDFKPSYNSTSMKTMCYLQKKRQINH